MLVLATPAPRTHMHSYFRGGVDQGVDVLHASRIMNVSVSCREGQRGGPREEGFTPTHGKRSEDLVVGECSERSFWTARTLKTGSLVSGAKRFGRQCCFEPRSCSRGTSLEHLVGPVRVETVVYSATVEGTKGDKVRRGRVIGQHSRIAVRGSHSDSPLVREVYRILTGRSVVPPRPNTAPCGSSLSRGPKGDRVSSEK